MQLPWFSRARLSSSLSPLCFLAASEGSIPPLDQYSWFLLAPVHVYKVKVQLCTESVLYKLARGPCQEGFLPSVNEAIFYNCSAWCRLPSNEELNRNRRTKKARAFCTQLQCRLASISLWHWQRLTSKGGGCQRVSCDCKVSGDILFVVIIPLSGHEIVSRN